MLTAPPSLLPTTGLPARDPRLESERKDVFLFPCSLEAREGAVGCAPASHLCLWSCIGIRKWEHPGHTWKEPEQPSLPKAGSGGCRAGPSGPSVALNAEARRETLVSLGGLNQTPQEGRGQLLTGGPGPGTPRSLPLQTRMPASRVKLPAGSQPCVQILPMSPAGWDPPGRQGLADSCASVQWVWWVMPRDMSDLPFSAESGITRFSFLLL